jgi:hypothetical protein
MVGLTYEEKMIDKLKDELKDLEYSKRKTEIKYSGKNVNYRLRNLEKANVAVTRYSKGMFDHL